MIEFMRDRSINTAIGLNKKSEYFKMNLQKFLQASWSTAENETNWVEDRGTRHQRQPRSRPHAHTHETNKINNKTSRAEKVIETARREERT